MNNELKRMHQLVKLLNEARKAYEQEAHSIMSDFEYDKLYDELMDLEKALGTTLSNSPTINVGYEVISELPKERHEKVMLSLDKTKDVSALVDFLGDKKGVISWKLDGLTVVLTYQNGRLIKGVTRGNGEIGEVITNNAKVFKGVPLQIPYKGELIVRGEAVIGYKDFNKLNEEIEDVEAKYKNPRNLCSGSVRQLNNQVTAKRNVHFVAFAVIRTDNPSLMDSQKFQLDWLVDQGFEVVEHYLVDASNVENQVAEYSEKAATFNLPTDGLVLIYDDIKYGESLGSTNKFPRNSIAFKWADEIMETTLIEVEWSPSRTGLINPIAIFAPVELEGTSVSRASLHNLSILEELELGIGDTIQVYKANMIIPQIADNLTRSGKKELLHDNQCTERKISKNTIQPPDYCPICKTATIISTDLGTKTLHCPNPQCQIKQIKSYTLFASRDALNIEGLSEATIEKFVQKGFIKNVTDIFKLEPHREDIVTMEGFGERSFSNLMDSIEKAKVTTLPKLIYGLGINNIGLATAKVICKSVNNDIDRLLGISQNELNEIPTIGGVIAKSFVDYFGNYQNVEIFRELLSIVKLEQDKVGEEVLEGKTFVITGSLSHFINRNELRELIEGLGGKVASSISAKTDYLINNDITSSSSKNRKAKDLGVEIISESDFREMVE